MKRRSFTFGLSALLTAPALPMAAATANTSGIALETFKHAKLLARSHNKSSVPMLMRHLKVDANVAKQINALLYERGIITAPIGGTSLALKPTNLHALPLDAPTQSERITGLRKLAKKLLKPREETSGEEVDSENSAEQETSEVDANCAEEPPKK